MLSKTVTSRHLGCIHHGCVRKRCLYTSDDEKPAPENPSGRARRPGVDPNPPRAGPVKEKRYDPGIGGVIDDTRE